MAIQHWNIEWGAKWNEFFSQKLALNTQIQDDRRPRRVVVVVVAQNPKMSLFHQNQVSITESILALFSHETAANDYFPQMRMGASIWRNVRMATLQKPPIENREFWTL